MELRVARALQYNSHYNVLSACRVTFDKKLMRCALEMEKRPTDLFQLTSLVNWKDTPTEVVRTLGLDLV